jgi:hypothetical protein
MEGCISRYVAFHATPQMGLRSSKMVQLFFAEALKLPDFGEHSLGVLDLD